jgi:ketosteroid isomerase-like protein
MPVQAAVVLPVDDSDWRHRRTLRNTDSGRAGGGRVESRGSARLARLAESGGAQGGDGRVACCRLLLGVDLALIRGSTLPSGPQSRRERRLRVRDHSPGYPRRAEGRTAVAGLYRPYGDALVLDRCYDLAVYHDLAPGTVVLEYASAGKVVATGAPYSNRYISVLTLRDREIVHWRDYLDPIAVFDALGWPPR